MEVSSPAPANSKDGYIIVEISYEKILLTLADGIKLIDSLKSGRKFKEEYNENHPKVSNLPPISFQYITEEQFNAWQVSEVLDL